MFNAKENAINFTDEDVLRYAQRRGYEEAADEYGLSVGYVYALELRLTGFELSPAR